MPGKRFMAEEIVNKLRQADVELARGSTVAAVCKLLGITDATYFRWRKEYVDLHTNDGHPQRPRDLGDRRALGHGLISLPQLGDHLLGTVPLPV